jgi:anti-sigma B factor antagonist
MDQAKFSVAVAHVDGHMLVTVRGEIDVDTAPQFTDALDRAVELPSPLLIVDMSAVTFIDSAACNALVHTREHAERADVSLQLRASAQGVGACSNSPSSTRSSRSSHPATGMDYPAS